MTENGLKEGDWVRIKDGGVVGVVTLTDKDDDSLVAVELPHRSIAARSSESLERIDRRTAFLMELKELLERYDARIYDHDRYRLYIDLGIHGKDTDCIVYTDGELNADNIMDFDKD